MPKKYWLIIASLLLTACASTSETHFYVLDALAHHATQQSNTKARVFGIGPLTLPSLLNRQQIVTRSINHRVQLAEFHQWAEPLKESVLQVLTKNLATLQPVDTLRSYPWSAYGNVQYRVIIDISRFDADNNSAVLEATWAIMSEDNHQIISNGHVLLKQVLTNTGYQAITQAMSQLLDDFAQQLTIALHELK